MIQYSVTGYFNTGFNQSNIPYSSSILNLATKKTFPAIYHWQDRDLSYVEIQSNFNEVSDIDYLQVGTSYYFVTDIAMESETNCAKLSLSIDGLTTCGGIDNISILSGWAERAHTGNDGLFNNVLPEPWTPTEELVIDESDKIGDGSPSGVNPIVAGGTVDLENIGSEGFKFTPIGSEDSVIVPIPKATRTSTTVVLNTSADTGKSANIPNCQMYFLTDPNDTTKIRPLLADNLQKLQGLGIVNDVISCCYQIPASYYDTYTLVGGSESAIESITSQFGTKSVNMPYKYTDGIKNNKVFSLYNSYRLISFCSSDGIDFDSHELFESEAPNSPVFIYFADLSPGGRPFARPRSFKGNTSDIFMQSVSGETWLNTPLLLTGRQGITQENFQFVRNGTYEVVKSTSKVLTNLLKPSAVGGFVDTAVNKTYEEQDLAMSNAVVAPNVMFPRSNSLQNFLGNIFYVIRTRLTITDAAKFDRFLTMYGYSTNKALEKSDFKNRQYFNYVKANGVNIGATSGMRTRVIAQNQLESGVRVWHTLPNPTYYNNNPIIS